MGIAHHSREDGGRCPPYKNMTIPTTLSASTGFWDSFQHAVNWLTQPSYFVTLATIVVVLLIVAWIIGAIMRFVIVRVGEPPGSISA